MTWERAGARLPDTGEVLAISKKIDGDELAT
jgi:hypothetical protein